MDAIVRREVAISLKVIMTPQINWLWGSLTAFGIKGCIKGGLSWPYRTENYSSLTEIPSWTSMIASTSTAMDSFLSVWAGPNLLPRKADRYCNCLPSKLQSCRAKKRQKFFATSCSKCCPRTCGSPCVCCVNLTEAERKSVIRSSISERKVHCQRSFWKASLKISGRRSYAGQDDIFRRGDCFSYGLNIFYFPDCCHHRQGRKASYMHGFQGAYLNASMKKKVLMSLDPTLSSTLCAMIPTYDRFLR